MVRHANRRVDVAVTYSEVTLSIEPADAAARIAASVTGIRRTRDDERYVYKSNSGTVLAIIKPAKNHDGRCTLRYRTTMISPQLAPARQKARQIRDLLEDYRI